LLSSGKVELPGSVLRELKISYQRELHSLAEDLYHEDREREEQQ
jgi:hypothetical protein